MDFESRPVASVDPGTCERSREAVRLVGLAKALLDCAADEVARDYLQLAIDAIGVKAPRAQP